MWPFILTLVVIVGGEVIHKVAEEIVQLQKNPRRRGFRDRKKTQEWSRSAAPSRHLGLAVWGLEGRPGGGPIPHPIAP